MSTRPQRPPAPPHGAAVPGAAQTAPPTPAVPVTPVATGAGVDAQAQKLVDRMRRNGLTIAVAESCTGGLLGGRITEVPGASKVFLGGVIAYDNGAKTRHLGVDLALFADGHGAVSAAVATAMAKGVRERFGTEMAVAVTGIAGPHGGSDAKPVGTVWVAALGPGDLVNVHRINADGDRPAVREAAVREAIRLVDRNLSEAEKEKLV